MAADLHSVLLLLREGNTYWGWRILILPFGTAAEGSGGVPACVRADEAAGSAPEAAGRAEGGGAPALGR